MAICATRKRAPKPVILRVSDYKWSDTEREWLASHGISLLAPIGKDATFKRKRV